MSEDPFLCIHFKFLVLSLVRLREISVFLVFLERDLLHVVERLCVSFYNFPHEASMILLNALMDHTLGLVFTHICTVSLRILESDVS